MLPQHLMSLHEISKREERTMALCVKKLNNTYTWDEQTATTAASPSTSTPPSDSTFVSALSSDSWLRRFWREFCLNINVDETTNEYTSPALQLCGRTELFECAGLSSDIFHRCRNGNVALNDRFQCGLQPQAKPQQRWLQLRKYWRHNARRRLRKTEREQFRQQYIPFAEGYSEETRTSSELPATDTNHRCKDSKELLWRRFRFIQFHCSPDNQHQFNQSEQQQQQYNMQQTKLRKLETDRSIIDLFQLQLSTREVLQCFNETTQCPSNNVITKSSEITTRPNATNVCKWFISPQFHDQLHNISNQLYINVTSRNTRRRAICDSMPPLPVARFKQFLTAKTLTGMSERKRPGVCMLQSITLESHPRNRYVWNTKIKSIISSINVDIRHQVVKIRVTCFPPNNFETSEVVVSKVMYCCM